MNSLPLKIYHRLDLYYINVSFFSWLSVFFRPSSVLGDVHMHSLTHLLTHTLIPLVAPSQLPMSVLFALYVYLCLYLHLYLHFIWTILNWIKDDACTLYRPCVFGFLCLSTDTIYHVVMVWIWGFPCSHSSRLSLALALSLRAHQKTLRTECIRYHIIKSNRLKFHADANKLCGFPTPLVCHNLLPVLSFLHPELMYFQPIFARTFVAFDYIFICFFFSFPSLAASSGYATDSYVFGVLFTANAA